MMSEPKHVLWFCLIIVLVIIQNSAGILITKYGSSAQRSTIECARIPIVWLYFMLVPIRYDEAKQQNVYDEYFTWLQLIGFSLLFVSVLYYNELLEIPFCGLNENTRRAIASREILSKPARTFLINDDSSRDSIQVEED